MPSVTEIIDSHGLINEFSKQEFAALRGSMVHLAARYFLEGRLDFASLDDRIVPYIQSLQQWVMLTGFVATECEARRYHPLLKFAGTMDCVGVLPNNSTFILDLKSGVPERWHGLQLAAYLILYGGYRRRGGLYLQKDGSMAEFREYDDPADAANFISCLNCYRLRER